MFKNVYLERSFKLTFLFLTLKFYARMKFDSEMGSVKKIVRFDIRSPRCCCEVPGEIHKAKSWLQQVADSTKIETLL